MLVLDVLILIKVPLSITENVVTYIPEAVNMTTTAKVASAKCAWSMMKNSECRLVTHSELN